MGVKRIFNGAWSASGSDTIELSKIPTKGPNGTIAYLRSLVIRVDISDLDSGATAVSPTVLNDIISSVSIEAGESFYGPRALSGADIQAVRAAVTGKPLAYIEEEGDAVLAACQSNATRQVYMEFPFWAFGGGESDFTPSVAYLAASGGRLQLEYSALPTNVTALTGTVHVYTHLEFKPELVATAPFICERQGIDTLEGGSLGRGRMLMSLLKNAAIWADGDITSLRFMADGVPIINSIEPDVNLAYYFFGGDDEDDEDAMRYTTGFGPIDQGTEETHARYIPVYPVQPLAGLKLSKRATANHWTYDIEGAETAGNMTWITARAKGLGIGKAVDQFTSVLCCDRVEVEDALAREQLKFKTLSKREIQRRNLSAHLPVKLTDSGLLAQLGIRAGI